MSYNAPESHYCINVAKRVPLPNHRSTYYGHYFTAVLPANADECNKGGVQAIFAELVAKYPEPDYHCSMSHYEVAELVVASSRPVPEK